MMRIIFWILVIHSTFYSQVFSQDTMKTSLVKGKFALQFQVNGLYFKPYEEGSLSCIYYIDDNAAVRMGIGFSGSTNLENKKNNIDIDNNRSVNIDLKIHYVQYLKTVDDVSLYLGTGPYYTRNFNKYVSYNYNNWRVGVDGILGMEWFFKNNMSLNGEYGILLGYNVSEYNSSTGNRDFTKSISVSSYELFKIGLSVYL